MERVVNKSKTFQEAEAWDICQHIRLTAEQRRQIARELKHRVYGKNVPDVREYHMQK